MSRTSKPPAIVLGGGVNGLEVARSLGRRGVPVTLVERTPSDIANQSRFVRSFCSAQSDPKELVHALGKIVDRSSPPPVLIYTSDISLKFVSEFREFLAERFRFVIAEISGVDVILDKERFNHFTRAHGLAAPRGMTVSSETPWSDEDKGLSYPVIVKPLLSYEWRTAEFVKRFGTTKAIRCDSARELTELLPVLHAYTSRMLVQELILGDDDAHYSVFIYRSPRFGEVTRLCINKQRVWPIRNGAGSFAVAASNSQMEQIAKALLEGLGWVGMASVCFKVERRTGEPMIHEINGRLPQLHGILRAAGIDLPYLMYLDALEQPLPQVNKPRVGVAYRLLTMDCAALCAYRRAGSLSRLDVLAKAFSRAVIAEFARDDPRPALTAMRQAVPSFLRALL